MLTGIDCECESKQIPEEVGDTSYAGYALPSAGPIQFAQSLICGGVRACNLLVHMHSIDLFWTLRLHRVRDTLQQTGGATAGMASHHIANVDGRAPPLPLYESHPHSHAGGVDGSRH